MASKIGNKRYGLFMVCLLLSFFAWFAVKLSKTYTQTYNFDLCFSNLPETKNVVFQSDTSFEVSFQCKGLYLMPIELNTKKLNVDYAMITTEKQKKRNYFIITKDQFLNYLQTQYDFAESIQTNIGGITIQLEDIEQ